MGKKHENEPVQIELGRLHEYAKMPEVPPRATETVQAFNRRASDSNAHFFLRSQK